MEDTDKCPIFKDATCINCEYFNKDAESCQYEKMRAATARKANKFNKFGGLKR